MEVAKLGIEVDASSAVSARTKLLDLANAGNVIGQTLRDMTKLILEQSGATAGLAQAHDRLATSMRKSAAQNNVSSPLIVDLDKQNALIAGIDSKARQLANVGLDQKLRDIAERAKESTEGLAANGEAASHAAGSHRGLQGVLIKVGEQMGLGFRISTELSEQLLRFGATGIAAAAGAGAVGGAIFLAIKPAREFDAQMDEVLKTIAPEKFAGAAKAIDDLKEKLKGRGEGAAGFFNTLFAGITGQITTGDLQKVIDVLEGKKFADTKSAINDISRSIRDQIALIGVDEVEAIRLAGISLEGDLIKKFEKAGASAAEATEKAKLLATQLTNKKIGEVDKKFAENNRKTIEQIDQQTQALRFEAAAIGATGNELIKLNTAQKVNQLATSELAKTHGGLVQNLIAETAAMSKLQIATAQIGAGRGLASQAAQTFNTPLSIVSDQSAVDLAKQFVPLFRAAGSDTTLRGEVNQMFSSLVQQAAASGTKNLSGLLAALGLSSGNIAYLRAGLGNVTTGFTEQSETVPIFQRNAFGSLETAGFEVRTRLVPQFTNVRDLLDESDRKSKNWSESLRTNANLFGEIGAAADGVKSIFDRIDQLVAAKRSMEIDVTPALNSLRLISDGIAVINGSLNGAPSARSSVGDDGVTYYDNTVRSATGLDNNTRVTS